MEMQAEVTGVDGDDVLVKVNGEGGCGHCHEPGGCHSGVLNQFFGRKTRIFRLENSLGVKPGDRVVVSVADGITLKTALVVYMVPVVLMMLGAALGTRVGDGGDLMALAGAGAGLLLSLPLVAVYRLWMAKSPAARPALARRAGIVPSCSLGR